MLVVTLQVNGTRSLNPQLYIVTYKLGFDYCNSINIHFLSSHNIIYSVSQFETIKTYRSAKPARQFTL